MTAQNDLPAADLAAGQKAPDTRGASWLHPLSVSSKLTLALGALLALVLLVTGISLLAGTGAHFVARRARQRLPVLETAVPVQQALQQIDQSLAGYLLLRGEAQRQAFDQAQLDFEVGLTQLALLRGQLAPENQQRLHELQVAYDDWIAWPSHLFALAAEPAVNGVRPDTVLYVSEIEPQLALMGDLLRDIVASEQALLAGDVRQANESLVTGRMQTVLWGVVALLLGTAVIWLTRTLIGVPLTTLARTAVRIEQGELDVRAPVAYDDETGVLARTLNQLGGRLAAAGQQTQQEAQRADDLFEIVVPVGVALFTESDYDALLEKTVVAAKNFCHADAGSLYLRTADDRLQFMVVRNDAQNLALGGTTGKPITFPPLSLYDDDGEPNWRNVAAYVALTGKPMNIAEAYNTDGTLTFSGPRDFDKQTGYRSKSMLTLPLTNVADEIVGVLQLINAKDKKTGVVVPFDNHMVQVMTSFASLAVAAMITQPASSISQL